MYTPIRGYAGLRGINELLNIIIAYTGITQMYLIIVYTSPSIVLIIFAIIIFVFLEGIVFNRGTEQEPKETQKRIAWAFILLLVNAVFFIAMEIENSVSILGAGFLLVLMNFEQFGAFLVSIYENQRHPQEQDNRTMGLNGL